MGFKTMRAIFFLLLVIPGLSLSENKTHDYPTHLSSALFAGGCFWCMEQPFDLIPGVIETMPGYSGGDMHKPSYKEVSSGTTGHYEVVKVIFDPTKVSYQQLLKVFWRNIDPTNHKGQFCDEGEQYRSAIFYADPQQKELAEKSKLHLQQNKQFSLPVKTQIIELKNFYPAEAIHHNFYKTNSWKYKFYRYTCGRDKRLNELWNK